MYVLDITSLFKLWENPDVISRLVHVSVSRAIMVLFSAEANLSQSYREFIETHLFPLSPHVISFSGSENQKEFNSGEFVVTLPVPAS